MILWQLVAPRMRSTCFTDAMLNNIDAQKVRPNHGGIHYVELRKSAPDGMIQEPYIDAPLYQSTFIRRAPLLLDCLWRFYGNSHPLALQQVHSSHSLFSLLTKVEYIFAMEQPVCVDFQVLTQNAFYEDFHPSTIIGLWLWCMEYLAFNEWQLWRLGCVGVIVRGV